MRQLKLILTAAAFLAASAAFAQAPVVDLSQLPQGYNYELEGRYGPVLVQYTRSENGSYYFSETYYASSDQPYIVNIELNKFGQTRVYDLPGTTTHFYFPHDCFAQIDLCAYSHQTTPVEVRPNRKGYNIYAHFERGVWIVDKFSSYQGGLKLNRSCYTLDEYGMRQDWLLFEYNPETYEYDLEVEREVRTVPALPEPAEIRLTKIRNTCLYDVTMS